jgi:hypothetical protein
MKENGFGIIYIKKAPYKQGGMVLFLWKEEM